MIFVTVGSQIPFDRLVRAIDAWSGRNRRNDVLAQIGDSAYSPQHMQFVKNLDPQAFRERVSEAELVVSHAGMGTVLTALQSGTPLLLMPRRGSLHETRNDHQVATVTWLGKSDGISVALDERELTSELARFTARGTPRRISPWASTSLLSAVRGFLSQT